ncbi:MAG: transposase [Rubrobacter sp.]
MDTVRGYRDTEPYRKALRKRAVWVEPLFAEAKDWHGMRRFRLRQLEKVNTEALLIAAGQNVKRLLLYGDRKPKKPAQVVALRPPETTCTEPDRVRQHRRSRGFHGPATLFSTG